MRRPARHGIERLWLGHFCVAVGSRVPSCLRGESNMIRRYQTHMHWFAFLLHRISGVALALFLLVHFWVLSYAVSAPQTLDGFLHWSGIGIVKFAEFGLAFLLSVHMFGGLRLMALEWFPWTSGRKTTAASAVAVSTLLVGIFLLRAI